jgi:HK97 family phage portal protein
MREETGTPTEIYVVDPTFYEHKLSPSVNGEPQKIVMWLYKDEKHPQGIPFRPYEILHFKKWNKWDFWRGVPPLTAHRENIEQDVNANIANTSLIKNKSVPPGIITSDQIVLDEQADAFIKRWEKQHKGSAKAYKIAVLGRGAKYQPIAMTPDDMGYMDMKKWNRTSILARYGLTAGVFGFRDDSSPLSGTDTKEQLKSVWTLTLIPELKFLETILKSEFFTRFALTMDGKFDTDVIPELQIDKTEQETRLRENIKVGLYTINEAREEADKDPLDWGDVWWRSFNLEPEDGSEKEEPPPPQLGPFGTPKPPQAPGTPPPVIPPKMAEKSQRWLVAYLIESTKRWESLIGKYRKEIDQWFYRQRSWYLDRYSKDIQPSITKTYDEFVFWAEEIELLKKFSKAFFLKALELTGQDLVTVMRSTGFNTDFDIYQVNIGAVVDSRIDLLPRIGDTMQKDLSDLIKEGTSQGFTQEQLADAIRDRFKDIEGKADTIARTELGAVKSEAQVQAYRSEGVHYIQWIHNPAMSITPRPEHAALDGTTAEFMSTTFGNGLYYPRDPNGDPGEVINCHCDFIPVLTAEG